MYYQDNQSELPHRQCNTKTYIHCIKIHKTQLEQAVVKGNINNNDMTARINTKQDIFSSKQSSQPIFY